jgi:hypothetical protein
MRLWQRAFTSAPNWRDYVGYTLWTLAFILQTTADYQKLRFKMNPANDVRASVERHKTDLNCRANSSHTVYGAMYAIRTTPPR